MKNLPATIIVSRTTGAEDERVVRISIEDGISHCRILEVRMSLEQWATACFSSHGEALVELHDDAPIGRKPEVKEELVPVPELFTSDKGWADKALKPFEVDGWIGRRDDLFNHHRRVGNGKQRVLFTRFLEPERRESA